MDPCDKFLRTSLNQVQGPRGLTWMMIKKLASGVSGDVFLFIQNKKHNEPREVAIKVSNDLVQLDYEAGILRRLQDVAGFPQLYYSGRQGFYGVLVMELLSYTLEDIFVMCDRKLRLSTVLLVADQILKRVEALHERGFVHCDIKPANFMLGRRAAQLRTIYLLDFGTARRYTDSTGTIHNPMRYGKPLTGTPIFASIRTHEGMEPSRRDDLEAVGYMLVFFLRGCLPWQGPVGERNKARLSTLWFKSVQTRKGLLKYGLASAIAQEKKFQVIMERKKAISIQALCDGLPAAFQTYLEYCAKLGYEEQPDYGYLRSLFRECYLAEGNSLKNPRFQWCDKIENQFCSATGPYWSPPKMIHQKVA